MKYALALVGCLLGCAACTYSTDHAAAGYPSDVQTVVLPMAGNRTFEADLAPLLTDAVAQAIATRTPYGLRTEANAESFLALTIVTYRRRVVSREDVTGLPRQIEIHMQLDVVWKNQRTGEELLRLQGLPVVAQHVVAYGEPEQVAQLAAMQDAAHAIVEAMRIDW